jgi:HEAT repeat protein
VTPLGFRSLLVLAACTALLLAGCPSQPTHPTPADPGKVTQPGKAEAGKPDAGKAADVVYLGKPVSAWATQFQVKDVQGRREAANELIRQMGTKLRQGRQEKEPLPEAMISVLAQALRDQDVEVRYNTARAISSLYFTAEPDQRLGPASDALLPVLTRALRDQDDRGNALDTVGHQAVGCLVYYGRDALPAFTEALKDSNPAVRKDAVGGLGRLAAIPKRIDEGWQAESYLSKGREPLSPAEVTAVVSALSDVLKNDKRKEVREAAISALAGAGKPGMPALMSATQSGDVATRKAVAQSLRLMRPPVKEAVPVLVKLLKDNDEQVRGEAVFALGQMGELTVAALPALLEASAAEDSAGKDAWATASRITKVPRSLAPALLPLLKSPEPKVRLKVVELVCELEEGDQECLTVLIELVKRRDSQIRKGAAQLLYRYGSKAKEAVPALIEIARNDADPNTRSVAVNALGAIGPDAKAAIPALKALQDDRYFGASVKEALKKIDQ